MTNDIKQRIEKIKNGRVPEGYSHTKIGIFPDDWSVVSFDIKFNRLDRKNDEDNQNVLTISAQQGLISQQDYYNSSYASENKKGYSLLYKGDFSYNKSYSGDYLYGAIKRLDKYQKGIVSPLYICFEPKEGTNSEFYLQYFEAGLFNGEIYKIAQEGARNHGLLNVSVTDFFKTHLVNPSSEEQQKIAEILMQCDKVIELKQKRIEEEKKLKKALMQNFFDVKNVNAKEVKLHSVCNFNLFNISENTDEEAMFFYIDISCVENGNIIKPTDKIAFKNAPVRARKKFCKNDILMSTVRPNLHSFVLVNFDASEYVCSTGFAVLTPKKQHHTEIIYQQLFSEKLDRQYNNLLVGTNYPALNTSDIKSLKVVIPTDDNECIRISEVLSKQDELISLLNNELDFYLTKKKALMQLLLTGIVRVQA